MTTTKPNLNPSRDGFADTNRFSEKEFEGLIQYIPPKIPVDRHKEFIEQVSKAIFIWERIETEQEPSADINSSLESLEKASKQLQHAMRGIEGDAVKILNIYYRDIKKPQLDGLINHLEEQRIDGLLNRLNSHQKGEPLNRLEDHQLDELISQLKNQQIDGLLNRLLSDTSTLIEVTNSAQQKLQTARADDQLRNEKIRYLVFRIATAYKSITGKLPAYSKGSKFVIFMDYLGQRIGITERHIIQKVIESLIKEMSNKK